MKTMVNDFFTKEKAPVNNAISFIHNGDIKKSFLSIEELHKYNDIDSLHCVFGADTSINFQYSFVVTLTDYIGTYEKACKKDGVVISTVSAEITAVNKLYSLASYGFKVSVRKDGKIAIISPRYQKLTSIRRIIDGCENYFNFEFISCGRYDGKELLNNVNVNHSDIIQEVQKTNRHFSIKWVTDRAPKTWN